MTAVAVIGAGTMGHGIAQIAALAGHDTRMADSRAGAVDEAIERIRVTLDGGVTRGKISGEEAVAALARITPSHSIEAAVVGADMVIEAVIEDIGVKQQLFRTVEALVSPAAVLATNTSSLSVAQIARATNTPSRVVGMHFFNPVHIMKLVEVVVHGETDGEVVERVCALAREMGKRPIRVQDSPGFASSRLGVVLGLEAMRMLEQGVAGAEDIDTAMELGYGHPMGPLKVTDLVGLDVRLAVAEYLHGELGDPHYAPPAILRRKVAAGELGKKTGKGFYEWP